MMSGVETDGGALARARLAPAETQWWRGAVIYQIYPRSFRDSNGDGVGDLQGVIDGLDYVARLGVDGVWLSPFFTSPMRDFGYDVADYCGVDPVFGTLDDFDRLVDKAHGLGLKLIIDQVYSHSSDRHPWFVESRRDRTNPKADWYVWADPKEDGAPPSNWQSVFGGGAWTWDSRRRQYYLHNFLAEQPDLNLHNPQVQDALLDVARFWLDRGVDGFRLDAINFVMHDPALRDNPPAPRTGRARTRPFDYQRHVYNQSHPDIPRFLERMRALTDAYDGVFTVAEVGGPEPLREMRSFTEGGRRLNSAYNFTFLYADKLTAALTKASLSDWRGTEGEGWPSWAFTNHDSPRAVTRWAGERDGARAAKLYAMLLLCLRGNAFVYQGEELGLPQADLPFETLQDPEAIANWPHTLGRDGARTPMPWRAGAPCGGFTTGRPWLPFDPRHADFAVDRQERDETSTLNFVRTMISLRKNVTALRAGDIAFIEAPPPLLAFTRIAGGETMLCVFNLEDEAQEWRPPEADRYRRLVDVGLDGAKTAQRPPSLLPPLSGYAALRQG